MTNTTNRPTVRVSTLVPRALAMGDAHDMYAAIRFLTVAEVLAQAVAAPVMS